MVVLENLSTARNGCFQYTIPIVNQLKNSVNLRMLSLRNNIPVPETNSNTLYITEKMYLRKIACSDDG